MENNKPLRVAQIICQCVNGGVEACIMNYYKHIDKTKIQFDFFVDNTSKIINKDEIIKMGGKIIIVPPYKKIFKFIIFLKKELKNYDIVHSNINALSVFPLYAAKKAKVKIRIAHSHSTTNKKEFRRNLVKNFLRLFSKKYATNYFACSKEAGEWLFGKKTLNKGEITIVNNAIDIEKFKFNNEVRDELRKEYNISNEIIIGNIGRFVWQKNQLFLLDVFSQYTKQNPNSYLLLIGDGPLYGDLIKKARNLNIIEKIIFAGTDKEVSKFYSMMDIFVFPSLYEGFGMVMLEAQASGLACIASNGVPKIVKNLDSTIFLDLINDAKFWADELYKVNLNSDRNLLYVKNSLYDIKKEAIKLEQIYFDILKI